MKVLIRRFQYGVCTVGLSLILVGCGQAAVPRSDQPVVMGSGQQGQPVSHGGHVRDQVSLIDQLRSRGMTVDIVGPVEQPFLKAKGTTLHISGGTLPQPAEVQVYNYADEDVGGNGMQIAETDSQQIEPDGNPRTMNILWKAPPHWFHKEQLIVFYSGTDQVTLNLLTELLGPHFAGK